MVASTLTRGDTQGDDQNGKVVIRNVPVPTGKDEVPLDGRSNLVAASAALTAVVLDYIAYTDLGFAQENIIRTQALVLAAIIGILLAAGAVIQKRSK